jgi:hypothetical protein
MGRLECTVPSSVLQNIKIDQLLENKIVMSEYYQLTSVPFINYIFNLTCVPVCSVVIYHHGRNLRRFLPSHYNLLRLDTLQRIFRGAIPQWTAGRAVAIIQFKFVLIPKKF